MGANHRYHLLALTVTIFIANFLVSKGASTQGENEQDLARQHYSKGKELYDAGDYAKALGEFEAAYEAKPHPVVLKSIAECLVQLGDVPGAIARYEQAVAGAKDKKDRKAQKRIKELKALLGTVEVTTTPSGAQIFINGKATDKVAPANLELGPGEYDITLSLEGYEPLVKHINLQKAQQVYLDVNFVTEGTAVAKVETDELAPRPELDEGEAVEADQGPVDAGQTTTYQLDSDSRRGPSLAFWIATAVTGVGLVSGTVFGSMALAEQSDFEDNPTMDKKDAGERDALIADISFGVAAAAAITGLVVLVIDSGDDESPTAVSASKNRINVMPVAGDEVIGVSTTVTF